MTRKLRSFQRRSGTRRYRKLFIIASEGKKTEPYYFNLFNSEDTAVLVKCIRTDKKSSPEKVLARLKRYIGENGLKKNDEAWLVVDRDTWKDQQLHQLLTWSQQKQNTQLAVSNPKFEFWLLLHFEDGTGVSSSRNCTEKLRMYLPHYDKSGTGFHLLEPGINNAVKRAKRKDTPACPDWPRNFGSTVYRLVENILCGQQ